MKYPILLFAFAAGAFAQSAAQTPAQLADPLPQSNAVGPLTEAVGTALNARTAAHPGCVGNRNESSCEERSGVFSAPVQPNGLGHRIFEKRNFKSYGPSVNFGNAGAWTITQVVGAPHVVFGTSGIDQYEGAYILKNGTGDLAGNYLYVYGGGRAAQSDEGVTGMTVESGEINGFFHGTIAGGGGAGATALSLTKAAKADHAWDYTCNGCMLLDISQGKIAGSLNGKSTPFGSTYLNQLPTTSVTVAGSPASLPLTHAWCTTQTAIPPTATAGQGTSRTINCTLGAVGGSTPPFTSGGVVTIAGQFYPEQATLVQATAPSGGIQSLTLLARNPNPAGSLIFQGGIAGQSLSFDANLAASGFRSSYYVFGSVDGSNLIYGSQVAGSLKGNFLPRLGAEAETPTSGFHLYPSAEVVANTVKDSAPLLEPNAVNWQNGDTVENPRFQTFGGTGVRDVCQQYTPMEGGAYSRCMRVDALGPGIASGYRLLSVTNLNPVNMYTQAGGLLDPPGAVEIRGPLGDLVTSTFGPAPSLYGANTVINITRTANLDNTPFNLFVLPTGRFAASTRMTYDPASRLIGFPQGLIAATLATSANCALKPGTVVNCGPASSGSFALLPGSNTVTVNTFVVTAASQIQITPDASLGPNCNKDPATAFAPYGIVARSPGHSFTLAVSGAGGAAQNCYSYTIVN